MVEAGTIIQQGVSGLVGDRVGVITVAAFAVGGGAATGQVPEGSAGVIVASRRLNLAEPTRLGGGGSVGSFLMLFGGTIAILGRGGRLLEEVQIPAGKVGGRVKMGRVVGVEDTRVEIFWLVRLPICRRVPVERPNCLVRTIDWFRKAA